MRLFIALCGFIVLSNCRAQQAGNGVTDIDGNFYETVIIDGLEWMAENLKTTKYSNGDPILVITSIANWGSTDLGEVSWYVDSLHYKDIYGGFYNTIARDDERGVCPKGWRLPYYSEIQNLKEFFGGRTVAGDSLKETGNISDQTGFWIKPNSGTNSSNFNLRPNGIRTREGVFSHGHSTYDQFEYVSANIQYLKDTAQTPFLEAMNVSSDYAGIQNLGAPVKTGTGIRCVKASPVNITTQKSALNSWIYPNPAEEKIIVSCSKCEFSIHQLDGRSVLIGKSDDRGEISIKNLVPGEYIILLNNEAVLLVKK